MWYQNLKVKRVELAYHGGNHNLSAAQLMNLAEATYARLSAAMVFVFYCDKRG